MIPNFEQPLPVLEVSHDALHIETKDTATGNISVKNIGGGMLSGFITSRHRALAFEPAEWTANAQTLQYTLQTALADIPTGGEFATVAYICTNGGEVALPVTVKLTRMAITARDGTVIANVRDFYEYALAHPSAARQIFTDSEFYMLLLAVGYPHMEVYENLHKDANRERALDNFFILSGLKEKTVLSLPRQSFVFDRQPGDDTKLLAHIEVEKSDGGFYEAPITVAAAAPWLTLSANRLISGDFDMENRARVNFAIDPAKIPGRYARARVCIEAYEAEIIFRRLPYVQAKLNRDSYRFDDRGLLEITNHSGMDMPVEVFCRDNFIRFAAKTYLAGSRVEIPFTVKLSAFMNAGRLFRKTPYMQTYIEIKAAAPGKVYRLSLPISVGEW